MASASDTDLWIRLRDKVGAAMVCHVAPGAAVFDHWRDPGLTLFVTPESTLAEGSDEDSAMAALEQKLEALIRAAIDRTVPVLTNSLPQGQRLLIGTRLYVWERGGIDKVNRMEGGSIPREITIAYAIWGVGFTCGAMATTATPTSVVPAGTVPG